MKKLRQFSHKSVSPAWGRLLYTLFLVMTLSMVFVQPAFAADTIWSKASEIMQDVYNQILLISTIAAIMLVIGKTKLPDFNPTVRGYCLVITLLIAWSTMAIKQHSIVDVAAGALLSVLLDYLYGVVKHGIVQGKAGLSGNRGRKDTNLE